MTASMKCPQCQAFLTPAASEQSHNCPRCGPASRLTLPADSLISNFDGPAKPADNKERACGDGGIPLEWQPGDLILDLYEIRPFGDGTPFLEGGMGRVNCAWHRGWNRILAVKSVKPSLLKASSVADFEREAEVWIDKLHSHPHIVFCHHVRVLGGLPRVFVEYVDGGSLADWVKDGKLYEEGPQQALERILDIAIQLAWALQYTHEQGLAHQDVKPHNVMMTSDGIAKLTDFGLARARAVSELQVEAGSLRADVTALAGTRAYLSPEQAKGERLTTATDIWSWGVSVHDMFVGAVARGFGPAALHALKDEANEDKVTMPTEVVALLGRCFRSMVFARPKNMQEIVASLRDSYQQVVGRAYDRKAPEPGESLADSLNDRALSLFELRKQGEAEQKWQEALRVDPLHPEANYNWGMLQWRSTRMTEQPQMTDQQLLSKLHEAKTVVGKSSRVDYLIGLVQLEGGDCVAAITNLRRAAKAEDRRAEIATALALAKSQRTSCGGYLRTFKGELPGRVSSVAWSPDGRFAISSNPDWWAIDLWEISSGEWLVPFQETC